ncbi:MAG: hypothetical protein RL030_2754 [Pseudomonadota bacterium]|jgi:hypothetical protein
MSRGVMRRPLPGQVLASNDGRTHQAQDVPGLPATFDRRRGQFVLPHNTAATAIDQAMFVLGTHRGGQLNYVLTRGSGIVRKGTVHIAGDASAPSVSDTAAAVGSAGITWSATASGSVVQLKIATDNSVAVSIRVRWELELWREP